MFRNIFEILFPLVFFFGASSLFFFVLRMILKNLRTKKDKSVLDKMSNYMAISAFAVAQALAIFLLVESIWNKVEYFLEMRFIKAEDKELKRQALLKRKAEIESILAQHKNTSSIKKSSAETKNSPKELNKLAGDKFWDQFRDKETEPFKIPQGKLEASTEK